MKCCGQERTTRFCPECGRFVANEHSLNGLLAMLRKRIGTSTKTATFHRTAVNEGSSEHESLARRAENDVAKWTAWADALQKRIEGDGTPDQ